MLGIGVNYMLINKRPGVVEEMNGENMVMPMVSVSLPIYRKKYKSMKNEAVLMQEASELSRDDLRNSLRVQYQQVLKDLNDAERRVILYSEQADLAQKTTDLLIAGFSSAGSDFEEVLRMQLRLLDYRFKQIGAVVDYNTTVANAEQLMSFGI